jgi:hypothetical protein
LLPTEDDDRQLRLLSEFHQLDTQVVKPNFEARDTLDPKEEPTTTCEELPDDGPFNRD